MYKKLFIGISIIIAVIFSFTICLANDDNGMLQDAADGVRNVVGNAENAIEDTAKDISNTSKDLTNDMENGANNVANRMTENNDAGNVTAAITDDNRN